MSLKGEPSKMQWTYKLDPSGTSLTMLSIVIASKTLFFHTMESPDSPIELAFQSKYGNIVSYGWFGESFVMIGFSTGYFIVVSTSKFIIIFLK
jgi:WD repeat-containing protein 19